MMPMSDRAESGSGLVRGPRRLRLSVRGAGFLGFAGLALVVAYAAGWPELRIVACFAAVPPLVALLLVWRRSLSFSVLRVVSPRVLTARAIGAVRLLVRNGARGESAPGVWWERLPWQPGVSAEQSLEAIEPDRVRELRYTVVPPSRGVVDLGPFVVRVADPFGLASVECEFGRPERVVVAPETVPLDSGVLEIAADSGSARLFQHRALAGEQDVMTREYRRGDALRRVHWRSSAHRGELMVREDERRSHASAVVLIETRAKRFGDVLGARTRHPSSELFEWNLSLVASLRDHLVSGGVAVSAVETAQPQLAPAKSTHDFVESLARVGLSFDDYRRPRWRDDASRGFGSVFAVLAAPDEQLVRDLVESRPLFDSAVAFVSPQAQDARVESLRRSGWSVVRVAAGEPVAEAWLRVGADG